MNIDRPLDEIIQEAAAARKAERAAKRKDAAQARKAKAAAADASKTAAPSQPKLGVAKKDPAAISKKQRRRERKPAAQAAAAAVAADKPARPPAPHPPNAHDKPRLHPHPAPNRLSTSQPAKAPVQPPLRAPPKGVKIRISNLHPGVTETDIAELFETVGPIKKADLKTFADGHSACEAEVIFDRMADALEAISRYNQVPLDNHPLHITLATDSIASPPEPEPVHSRVGKGRGRPHHNGRKADFSDDHDSPDRGNGYPGARGDSPDEDRQGAGGRRQNRRRYRRYNKAGNANGNANGGARDSYD